MVRSIFSVIVGYLAMAIFIMVTLTVAWLALGPSFALKEGTVDVKLSRSGTPS